MPTSSARPLRVLYVCHAANLTGASQSLLDILRNLDRSRVEPVVLVGRKGPLEAELDKLGVEHHRVPYISSVRMGNDPYPLWLKRLLRAVGQPGVDRFVAQGGFDVVHTNSLLVDAGMKAAEKAGVPSVVHAREFVQEDHGFEFLEPHAMDDHLAKAAAVIAISDPIRDKFARRVPRARVLTMMDGIDVAKYLDEGHPELLSAPPARLVLAGRFAANKGHMDAVRAVELLAKEGRQVHLTLVGGQADGPVAQECRDYVAGHGLSGVVDVLGHTDDLKALRHGCDISLTCSTVEALGRVTVEGMLSGCLVVGANAGGTAQIVDDGKTGLLYRPGDPRDLADKVAWALDNVEGARDIAKAGQAFALEAFDGAAYARRLEGLYAEVAGGQGAASGAKGVTES